MTREEAIKRLEETIQDTDTYWESCSEALQKELDEQKEVFLLALAALHGPTREMGDEFGKYKKFKEYFDDLYGKGLEVENWHMNGETIPFDDFYESACEYAEL